MDTCNILSLERMIKLPLQVLTAYPFTKEDLQGNVMLREGKRTSAYKY